MQSLRMHVVPCAQRMRLISCKPMQLCLSSWELMGRNLNQRNDSSLGQNVQSTLPQVRAAALHCGIADG